MIDRQSQHPQFPSLRTVSQQAGIKHAWLALSISYQKASFHPKPSDTANVVSTQHCIVIDDYGFSGIYYIIYL
jgi:hypothetical protein